MKLALKKFLLLVVIVSSLCPPASAMKCGKRVSMRTLVFAVIPTISVLMYGATIPGRIAARQAWLERLAARVQYEEVQENDPERKPKLEATAYRVRWSERQVALLSGHRRGESFSESQNILLYLLDTNEEVAKLKASRRDYRAIPVHDLELYRRYLGAEYHDEEGKAWLESSYPGWEANRATLDRFIADIMELIRKWDPKYPFNYSQLGYVLHQVEYEMESVRAVEAELKSGLTSHPIAAKRLEAHDIALYLIYRARRDNILREHIWRLYAVKHSVDIRRSEFDDFMAGKWKKETSVMSIFFTVPLSMEVEKFLSGPDAPTGTFKDKLDAYIRQH